MGKRGAKPAPSAMKLLLGNPGRRPISEHEVTPDSSAPVCPDWLGEVGRAYWQAVMDAMPSGFIRSVDGQLLSQYCHAWEEFHLSRKALETEGRSVTSDNGVTRVNPTLTVMNNAADRIRRLAACFGFSPADRVGLDFGGEDQPDDPLLSMMAARAGRN